MTTYTKRDLRSVSLLVLVLFSVGILSVAVACLRLLSDRGDSLLLWIVAISAMSLGTALNPKLRQLLRNQGSEEPNKYDGVFE